MRQRITGAELKVAVEQKGVDVVNSDEEQNGVLDEAQQEQFITQMTMISHEYIQRWKGMFSWLAVFVLYMNSMSLVGIFPLTRHIITAWTPQSVTVQFFLSPAWLAAGFYGHIWSVLFLQVATLFAVLWISANASAAEPPAQFKRINRVIALVSFALWSLLSALTDQPHVFWGRHTVLIVSVPLLSFAAETYLGSRELALGGLDKLNKFKYTHRKV